ncbi:MAG: ABC transporter permease [Armatimonadetes bacterium]|nr:ABC transporter permease [Armatimonadota bacterium]
MRLAYMLRKEFSSFRRNPVLLRMAILLPLMQTFILSYARNLDVVEVPLSVCDEAHTPATRALITKLDSTPYFHVVRVRLGPAELQDDLDRGTAALALHLPPHFDRDVARGRARVQVLVDGGDSATVSVAANYLALMLGGFDRRMRLDTAARRGLAPRIPATDIRSRVFYNPDLRTLWFMAPGVMAMVLTILLQNLTALSIARERELGTLEQLVMTPIRPWELLLGKLTPFAVVGCVDATIVSLLVHFWFGVPLRGSVPTLMTAVLIFLFATLGLGLLVSTLSSNQQQAQLLNFFLSFPSILLSGFIFPVANLPKALQAVSVVVPMTHLLEVIRGVFLRGSGFGALWPSLARLAVLAVCFFALGVTRFQKRLD